MAVPLRRPPNPSPRDQIPRAQTKESASAGFTVSRIRSPAPIKSWIPAKTRSVATGWVEIKRAVWVIAPDTIPVGPEPRAGYVIGEADPEHLRL